MCFYVQACVFRVYCKWCVCVSLYEHVQYILFCPYVSEVTVIRGWHCSVPLRPVHPVIFPCQPVLSMRRVGPWPPPPTHNHERGRHPFHTTPLKCPQRSGWVHRPPQALRSPRQNSTFLIKQGLSEPWASWLNPPLSPPHCDTDS